MWTANHEFDERKQMTIKVPKILSFIRLILIQLIANYTLIQLPQIILQLIFQY